jgi:uncharacterized DUF497 family protein
MNILYDPTKEAANLAKHGVSMALASEVEWGEALVWQDARLDYGEPRMSALAPYDGRLFFMAFVDRADGRRIISLRKANPREVRRYVSDN